MDDFFRAFCEGFVVDAKNAPTLRSQPVVSPLVGLAVKQGGVAEPAVDLDQDPFLAVDKIDASYPVVAVAKIDFSGRKLHVIRHEHLDQETLELARRRDVALPSCLQELPHQGHAVTTASTYVGNGRPERSRRHLAASKTVVESSLQLAAVEDLAVVEQRFSAADPDKDGTLDARELNTSAGRALLKLLR